jgi:hypothetical protein
MLKMSDPSSEVPVHKSLNVLECEDIYRNEEWWKSVVRYQYKDSDSRETAVYLWHRGDDGWKRKNKYVIKTVEAWGTDRQIIESLIDADNPTTDSGEFPVSDYYNVAAGLTVFQSEDWWKAIVKIDEKGSYETDETVVYLWQYQDDDWRRRQKYTIKDRNSWEEERKAIETVLEAPDEGAATESASTRSPGTKGDEGTAGSLLEISDEVADLDAELEAHLSEASE